MGQTASDFPTVTREQAVAGRDDPLLAGTRDEEGSPLVFYLHPEMTRLNEMIRLLVKHGADLNAQDKRGKTLLARALAHKFTDSVNALRAHGATT